MARETLRRHRVERTGIDAALRRLDDGSYGACLACGEPIAPGRLAAEGMRFFRAHVNVSIRITSYNVCYTKLLRTRARDHRKTGTGA